MPRSDLGMLPLEILEIDFKEAGCGSLFSCMSTCRVKSWAESDSLVWSSASLRSWDPERFVTLT